MSEALVGRLRCVVRGAVQGVGFRPFVYRLATELGLRGWVSNSAQGVFLEVEGDLSALQAMLRRLEVDRPPRAVIHSFESWWLDPIGLGAFAIRESDGGGEKTVLVLPDIATCEDCAREIHEPGNRRFRYPFTNCTNCGPRYSIVEALPYDRANTTMKAFDMCRECRREYDDPANRRFHAQPNACPVCGPQVELWTPDGLSVARAYEAIVGAAEAVCSGRVVALKGLGGFQLLVDACNDDAVKRLRERKRREHKPLALMAPDLAWAERLCAVGELERRALTSPEAPIVLMTARAGSVAPAVAPGNPCLGVMLPYTPLHNLFMKLVGGPVVATSGNLSDEPMCIDERDALVRLGDVADLFLVHNRPIRRHVDDSIVRVMAGRETVMRRARGFAPLPVVLGRDQGPGFEDQGSAPTLDRNPPPHPTPHTPYPEAKPLLSRPSPCILAVGAHLKNAVALAGGNQVFLDRHIGDLETPEALAAFERACGDLPGLYEATPEAVACDLHPDYLSTRHAHKTGLPRYEVQHHYAHVLACMADNDLDGEVLGVSWDGSGLGTDGTVWGGEFIRVFPEGWERVAHLRTFPLPGGDKAAREPRRCALGVLKEIGVAAGFRLVAEFEEKVLLSIQKMLRSGTNCPKTSSAGRLFDAAASFAGLRQVSRFEGEAAMGLEFAVEDELPPPAYTMTCAGGVLDWEPMIREMLDDVESRAPVECVAGRFHSGLAAGIVKVAQSVGVERVLLTGGCFQNRRLLEWTIDELTNAGFKPHWHQRIPPNDGGIAVGQAVAAVKMSARS